MQVEAFQTKKLQGSLFLKPWIEQNIPSNLKSIGRWGTPQEPKKEIDEGVVKNCLVKAGYLETKLNKHWNAKHWTYLLSFSCLLDISSLKIIGTSQKMVFDSVFFRKVRNWISKPPDPKADTSDN